jgi:protein gp37
MLPPDWGNGFANVWLGTTTEDQERFEQRWPLLAAVPAAVRFVSYEPAIGALRLWENGQQPDWLICGGESGGRARPLNPSWVREIISDCRRRGVAPFMKQWGTYASNPIVSEGGRSEACAQELDPYGKGGGLVEGQIIREFPVPTEGLGTAMTAA